MSAGMPLPKTVLAHGFVHGDDGRKMSKSIGNVVDPYDVLQVRIASRTFVPHLPTPSPTF